MDTNKIKSLAFGAVLALVAGLAFMYVAGVFSPSQQNLGAAYVPNRYPHGYWDTGGGYYVDGVAAVDSSRNAAFAAVTATATGTFANVTASGHLISSGSSPTVTTTGSGYVPGSFVSGSTDVKGSVTSTVGSAAGSIVVSFATAFASAPICVIRAASSVSATTTPYVTSTVSAFAIVYAAGGAATGTAQFNYFCAQ